MPKHETRRQQIGAYGAHVSWANTSDRSARTRPARQAGPNSIEWHEGQLDPEKFADATDAQKRAAAESAKKAYFAALAMKSAAARRRGGDAA